MPTLLMRRFSTSVVLSNSYSLGAVQSKTQSYQNLINGVNVWAVGVVRKSAGIVNWTKEELVNMDRRPRKVMAMNGCVHTTSNVARLYTPWKGEEA